MIHNVLAELSIAGVFPQKRTVLRHQHKNCSLDL